MLTIDLAAGNRQFCVSRADEVEPSFCTTISFGSGSTQLNSSIEYVLNFSNFIQLQFRAGHFPNALPNAKL
jgi:hypothetical protein